MDFLFYFKMWFYQGRVSFFWQKKKSEKAEHQKKSFGGSMPEAQIKRCPLTPPLYIGIKTVDLNKLLNFISESDAQYWKVCVSKGMLFLRDVFNFFKT